MDKKTTGAWIIHHTAKLQQIVTPTPFDRITFAGKAGVLLSAISETSKTSQLTKAKLETLAKASNINPYTELPTLLNYLQDSKLIEKSSSGSIEVLGLTTAYVLQHTTDIFNNTDPQSADLAVIDASELVSKTPATNRNVTEYISDTYHLSTDQTTDILLQSEEIGFVDYEPISENEKLYFNGNLFRRDNPKKVHAIVCSLSDSDSNHINEIDNLFEKTVALPIHETTKVLGEELFKKLVSIGMYDINTVSNERDNLAFVTKPAVFSKYGNTLIDDALDLVKAFVTSLTYGMSFSPQMRGRITMLPALMNKLIRGEWVGPATAIGHDYKVLEYKRVIEVQSSGSGMFRMRLLKKDVGELALQALVQGDISETSVPLLAGASITSYTGPEPNREMIRKKQTNHSRNDIVNMLRTLRS